MDNITIKKCIVGMISTNCYMVINNETNESIIIDPGDNAEKIEKFIEVNNLKPVGIMLTHGHFDHMLAASDLAKFYNISIYAGADEKQLLYDCALNVSEQFGRKVSITPDVLLQDDEVLTLGGMNLKVIFTPGHTGGSVCYYFYENNILMTGDTLFKESIGRTDFPTGNHQLIMASMEVFKTLNDDIIVYPGHGEETSIAYEREHNVHLMG